MPGYAWSQIQNLGSKSYTCGYCGNPLASALGWSATPINAMGPIWYIYVCHHCDRPSFFEDAKQTPSPMFGDTVKDVQDKSVSSLYDEARRSTGAGAYTATVLCCRKLLMHIAVSKGAPQGQDFLSYVQYLADNNYVPPDAKGWVDQIRTKGNEANHDIVTMTKDDAEELISFVGMLLKIIFEFPAKVKAKKTSP